MYSAQAVMDCARRKAAEMVGNKLASTAARRVVAKFIPIVNAVSLAVDIYDGAQLAKDAYDTVSNAIEGSTGCTSNPGRPHATCRTAPSASPTTAPGTFAWVTP